jgi:hypothetical protein
MSLANLKIETAAVQFRGGEFTVRGLGLDTVAALMHDGNREELGTAVNQLEVLFKATKAEDSEGIKQGINMLMVQLPGLAAKVIAYAADEPGEVDKVRKLPLPIQLEAILAIGRLTFEGEDSIRNFVSGLVTLMASATAASKIAGQTVVSIGTKG